MYDFDVHQQIIWDRSASPNQNNRYFTPITEYIYWIVKDRKEFYFNKDNSVYKHTIWRINPDKNPHPAPFPYIMAANIINCCSKEGDIVYDPFMGSGTTALACLIANRHFIGFEIDKKYYDISMQRIKQEQSQMRLF